MTVSEATSGNITSDVASGNDNGAASVVSLLPTDTELLIGAESLSTSLPPTFHDPSASVILQNRSRNTEADLMMDGGTSAGNHPSTGVVFPNRHQKHQRHTADQSTPETIDKTASFNNDKNTSLQQPVIGITHHIVSSSELYSPDSPAVAASRTAVIGGGDGSGVEQSWNDIYAPLDENATDPSKPRDGSGAARPADRVEHIRRILRVSTAITEVTSADIQRVRMVYQRFYEDSILSFNYNCLLIIASILAALGLAANSSATIIASMLVSPLMGPVVGIAYGRSIGDNKLAWTALKTEIFSLTVCILTGMLCGGCMAPFEISDPWPTSEMQSRATYQNLYVGIPIAFFSGLGVAVSLLDDQTSSLVGVAISASLLPPAVNAGLLFVTSFLYEREWPTQPDYKRTDFYKGGAISLGLTLVNIVLIIIASMIMFRVKERLPIRKKKIFWTDLGLARKIYNNQAIRKEESINLETPNPVVNRVNAVGKRVSTLIASPFIAHINHNNRNNSNGNSHGNSKDASIPVGSVDPVNTIAETTEVNGRPSNFTV